LKFTSASGTEIGRLGLGTWVIGGDEWGPTDDQESIDVIRKARDHGVTFFDTADVYGKGHSEELLARALEGHRDGTFIATKAGNDFYQTPERKNFAPAFLRFAVEQSLRRLRTDALDLFQLHNPKMAVIQTPEVWEELNRLKDEGKIRYYGISVYTPEEAMEAVRVGGVQSVQIVYNILAQEPARELFPFAQERGVAVIARVPLQYGLLTAKYTPETTFSESDHRAKRWTREEFLENLRRVDRVRFLANAQRTLAQAATAFVLGNPAVMVTIPGARNTRQLEDNLGALGQPLTPEEVAKVVRLYDTGFAD